ncbi:UNVERIFIED_CONTAM: hypothetical protein GTU68_043318, partial [Idotea baltica]|nr:hypothetical protein [Idotea baltica]
MTADKNSDKKIDKAQEEVKKSFAAKVNPAKAAAEKPVDNTQQIQEELDATKGKVLVLAAELDNLRKRHTKEIEDSHKFAVTNFAKDMLDVLENLYRAEESIDTTKIEADETLRQIFSGVELTKKTLVDAFEKNGLKRISPTGEQFNHDFHQAITQVESDAHKTGEVVQVIQAGYVLKD